MSFMSRLFGSTSITSEFKASSVGRLLAYIGIGQPVWSERDFEPLAREGYMQNPIVYRCVAKIAQAVADIPVGLYDGTVEIEDHPLLRLIKRPNPEQTRQDFIISMVAPLALGGNAYIERVGIRTVRELYSLRPDRMKPITGEKGWPSAYEYEVAGQRKRFPVRSTPLDCDVLHLRSYHPLDDYHGMGPLDPAARSTDIHNSSASWLKALIDNSARPSGAMVYNPGGDVPAHMPPEQYARLKEEMEQNHQGAANAGRPMLLEGGLDWKPMGLSPLDMDFINSRREMAREIALAFGVPPMVLGIPGDNTYSNYQEANAAFYRETVIPFANKVYARLSQWLSGPMEVDGLELRPDLDEIPALAEERKTVWDKVNNAADVLTVNERREAMGYGPLPGEDGAVVIGLTRRPVTDEPPETRVDPDER